MIGKHRSRDAIEKLLEVMATLRDAERGCPWDREQTFATIAPYTIEEAYEVADAIERGDFDELRSELGDLLFQVVFHARMAEEQGRFDFADVAAAIGDKLVRRHPHVFGGAPLADAAEQTRLWEAIKREERAAKQQTGLLDDVPVGLPALSRAAKLGKRAAQVGFDWPNVKGVRAKLDEEVGELDAAMAAPDGAPDAVAAEIGDLLFTVANLCRHLDLDPESCARAANARFARRFARVEAAVAASGKGWPEHTPDELDRLWTQAKAEENQT